MVILAPRQDPPNRTPQELLLCTDTILRGVLPRLNVDVSSLSRLLHVTANLYRKTHPGDNGVPTNPIILVIFEMLADTLRLKTRTLPAALRAMLEVYLNHCRFQFTSAEELVDNWDAVRSHWHDPCNHASKLVHGFGRLRLLLLAASYVDGHPVRKRLSRVSRRWPDGFTSSHLQ